jgi:hypothetical protein
VTVCGDHTRDSRQCVKQGLVRRRMCSMLLYRNLRTKNQAGKTIFLVEHDRDYCWVHLGTSATVWGRWVFRAGVGREAVS